MPAVVPVGDEESPFVGLRQVEACPECVAPSHHAVTAAAQPDRIVADWRPRSDHGAVCVASGENGEESRARLPNGLGRVERAGFEPATSGLQNAPMVCARARPWLRPVSQRPRMRGRAPAYTGGHARGCHSGCHAHRNAASSRGGDLAAVGLGKPCVDRESCARGRVSEHSDPETPHGLKSDSDPLLQSAPNRRRLSRAAQD